MGHKEHHDKAGAGAVVFIITVSDTRTEETDESGRLIKERIAAAGHRVCNYRILPDEPEEIKSALLSPPSESNVIIINGGTGVSKRDTTFEAINSLFDKTLPGFGEIFRMLSYNEIGSAAIMSRATAGVVSGRILFSIPGSKGAVSLAMDRLIIPELPHILWEISR